jgi:periplasmic divalent cation tolerance protein
MSDLYQVILTAGSPEEASHLGTMAVRDRLAACAQVSGPISSTYWWEGRMETAREWVCTLKTTAPMVERLVEELERAHSYDVPEIVAVALHGGNARYLDWVRAETRGPDGSP